MPHAAGSPGELLPSMNSTDASSMEEILTGIYGALDSEWKKSSVQSIGE